jgi:uncharacterized membrane protein
VEGLVLLLLVVFVLLVVFIARTAAAAGKIDALSKKQNTIESSSATLFSKVHEIEARLAALEQHSPAASPQKPEDRGAAETRTAAKLQHTAEPAAPAPPTPPKPVIPEPALVSTPPPLFTPATPRRPSRTKEEWEALIGGKLLNRIGALALIIGVGFFLKYAFDKNWITESVRVLIGVLIGASALLVASRSHRKGLQIFAQGLVGAGIAILYLSVYASFNFYTLISQPVAFAMMAGVTIIAFTQAFKYNSFAVSFLGWLGGFLTPILLSSGESLEASFFTYLALLDIGLIVVLLRKDAWFILEPLSLLGTYALYYSWFNQHYTDNDLALTLVFLVVFWGLFHALNVARGMNRGSSYPELRRWEALVNAALFTTALFDLINPHHHEWMALATAIAGMFYVVTALVVERRRPDAALPVVGYLLTAVVLFAIAVVTEFDSFNIVIAWTAEALLVLWAGVKLQRRYLWWAGCALLALSSLTLLGLNGSLGYGLLEEFRLLVNPRFLAFVFLAGTIGFSIHLLRGIGDAVPSVLVEMLHYTWIVLAAIAVSMEMNDHFRSLMVGTSQVQEGVLGYRRFMMLGLMWALCSLPLLWSTVRQYRRPLYIAGLALLVLTVLMLLGTDGRLGYKPIETFQPLLNLRAAAYLIAAGAIGMAIFFLKRLGEHRNDAFIEVLHYGWILVLLVLMTIETNDFFRRAMIHSDGLAKDALSFSRYMVLAVVWAITSLPLIGSSAQHYVRPTLFGGIWILLTASCLAAIRGIAFDPLAWFVPLLNVRVLSIAMIIVASVAAGLWLKRAGGFSTWVPEMRNVIRIALVVLLLVMTTGEIRDFFQRDIAVPSSGNEESLETIRNLENLQQMSLSGGWLVFSILLMGYGIWRRARSLRILAIGLFGFTILKIFIYDLSFLETVYRIVSFIALGVILLAVSYLYQRYRAIIFEPSPD